jgi:AraC-like DNA-binding protein
MVAHFQLTYVDNSLSTRMIVYFILLVICVLIWQYRVSLQAVLTEEPAPVVEIVKAAEKETPPAGDPAKYREVISVLDLLMQEKKLYTDAELTMEKLSHESKLSRHAISEALNQYAGKSFYAYVNDFRVMEMVRHLDRCKLQDITPNMLVLAYEAGFKSKSSFNKYFKQVTGLTPSMYLHEKKTVVAEKDTAIHPLFPTRDTATA